MEQILPRLSFSRQLGTTRAVAATGGERPFAPGLYKAGGRVGPERHAGRFATPLPIHIGCATHGLFAGRAQETTCACFGGPLWNFYDQGCQAFLAGRGGELPQRDVL